MTGHALPIEIAPQVAQARAVIERHLGSLLRALHVYSSAVDGAGLKPRSDIDLMVTVGAPLQPAARRALMRDLLDVSAPPGTHPRLRALEVTVVVLNDVVPWRYPARREMQFGEWLRHDILAGVFEPPLRDPDLAILVTKVRQHSVRLVGPEAAQLFDRVPAHDLTAAFRDTLAQWQRSADWEGDEQTVVLALARIWYSAATGHIAPKQVAATWVLERLPQAHRAVLGSALAAYLGTADDGLRHRPAQVAAFVRFARQAIETQLAPGDPA